MYSLHYDFCTKVLGYPFGLEVFNEENYSNHRNRNYVLGTLNYFEDSKQFALEFFADNLISGKQLNELFSKIESTTFIGDSLKIFLNNENIIKLFKDEKINLPFLTIDEIYSQQTFQPISKGISYGYLRIFESTKNIYSTNDDIVVIKGSVLEVPFCNALITNSFQTPLSHISIITKHRNIPACALKTIFSNQSILALKDSAVRIKITEDSLFVSALSKTEIEKFITLKNKEKKSTNLTFDTVSKKIILIKEVRSSQAKCMGNKAFEFSELYDLSQKSNFYFKTPEAAFCIPFYYYQKHILNTAIAKEINVLHTIKNNDSLLSTQLKKIRMAIKKAPLDSSLLTMVIKQLKTNTEYKTFRFRSSSNAEDLYEFCGAGLYDSYTGNLLNGKKDIEQAIKKVWASVFNERAYLERRLFGINEQTVMMGVLVHRSFPNEKSNGVVITKNIYRNDYPGFIINAQFGDVSVVRPNDSITSEQIICNDADLIHSSEKQLTVKYICRSNVKTGNVLDSNQLNQLYNSVKNISNYYLRKTEYIDVEFKFDSNNELYIKQVRPYK